MKKIFALLATGIAILPLAAPAQTPPAVPAPAPPAAPDQTPPAAPAPAPTPPVAVAPGQLIINETFQENASTDGYPNVVITTIRIAPINAPGASWQLASGDDTYETFVTPATATSENPALRNSAAGFHNVASAALTIASSGAYVKPSTLTISADLSFGGLSATGYDLLGFYSALAGKGTVVPTANFTGLQLQMDGSLVLIENGVPATTAPIAYTGKYDPTKPVTLTYTIDTAKGTISNVSLTGSTNTYAFTTTAFTNAATAFAGIGGQTDGQSWSFFNNLQIASGASLPAHPPSPAPAPSPAPSPSKTP